MCGVFLPLKEYLQSLHDCYEDWLGNERHHSWHGHTPVLVCTCTVDTCCIVHDV